jgi:Fis family transcriptional regulator
MSEMTSMHEILSTEEATTTAPTTKSLQEAIAENLDRYFENLGDTRASNVYDMVLAEVEVPLLKRILKYTRGNQSKAAIVLGLSRGTLRKKLKIYGMEGRIKEIISQD